MKNSRKILLTGGTGMVGHSILENSASSSWEIISPTRSNLNLSNYYDLVDYINDIKPEFIIHAAGHVGGISANISNPVNFLINNFEIGKNLILAANRVGVKKLLNLGASCMYPRNALNPLKEEMILKGELEPTNEAYALAKISIAKLCSYISQEDSEFKYKTIVPCNLYGRYDKFDPVNSHLIPAIIDKLHNAIMNDISVVEIWGDGNARREFMYAQDLADAVFYALNNFETMPSILNIGPGEDFSINDYYLIVAQTLKFKGVFKHNLEKPTGMKQKLLSIEKQKIWGWSPKITLKDGIQKTYDYYLKEISK